MIGNIADTTLVYILNAPPTLGIRKFFLQNIFPWLIWLIKINSFGSVQKCLTHKFTIFYIIYYLYCKITTRVVPKYHLILFFLWIHRCHYSNNIISCIYILAEINIKRVSLKFPRITLRTIVEIIFFVFEIIANLGN